MSELVLRRRLLTEIRQSPGKAAVLGVGMLVALLVWGPRLSRGLGAAPVEQALGVAVDGTDGGSGSIENRDPGRIRSEFIRISREARELRDFADPVAMREVARDPFAALGPAPVALVAPAPPERSAAELERDAANRLRLTGVFRFARGASAILDGEVVRLGGRVGPFTLKAVGERAVELAGEHGSYTLEIAPTGLEEEDGR